MREIDSAAGAHRHPLQRRILRAARVAGAGATSGLLAGLAWGVGARIAMRIMALAGRGGTDFSLEGTTVILGVGLVLGMPLGLLYSAVRPRLPPSRWAKAAIAGIATLALLGYPFSVGPLRSEAVLGQERLAQGLFFSLLALLGGTLEATFAPIERRVVHSRRRLVTSTMIVASGGAAGLLVLLFILLMTAMRS